MSKHHFCPFIYTDGRSLYLEFDKMVLSFEFSDNGLHKALKHVPNIALQPGYVPRNGAGNIVDKVLAPNSVARKTPPVRVSPRTLRNRETKMLRERFGHGADDIARKLMMGKLK